jgi:hypothetical protein
MTTLDIPRPLRELVRQRAGGRCEYCQTSEWLSGLPCEIDHIIPRAHDGSTTADNLCLACPSCNGHKQARTHAPDPESGSEVPLFHPRRQQWTDHLAWNEEGTRIVGLTDCGRATIEALKVNNPLIVAARAIWVSIGLHPPFESQQRQ